MPKLRNSNDSAIVAMENIFQMMFLCLWLNSRFGGWPTARFAPHDGASLTNYNKSGGHQEAAEPNCQQRITESRRAADSTLCYAQQSCHHHGLIKTASDGLHLYRSWSQRAYEMDLFFIYTQYLWRLMRWIETFNAQRGFKELLPLCLLFSYFSTCILRIIGCWKFWTRFDDCENTAPDLNKHK